MSDFKQNAWRAVLARCLRSVRPRGVRREKEARGLLGGRAFPGHGAAAGGGRLDEDGCGVDDGLGDREVNWLPSHSGTRFRGSLRERFPPPFLKGTAWECFPEAIHRFNFRASHVTAAISSAAGPAIHNHLVEIAEGGTALSAGGKVAADVGGTDDLSSSRSALSSNASGVAAQVPSALMRYSTFFPRNENARSPDFTSSHQARKSGKHSLNSGS